MEEAVIVRPGNEDDRVFILDSWLKSYKNHSNFTKNIPQNVFFTHHAKVIKALLEKSSTTVAAGKEAQEVILGYIIHEPTIVHYLYVKEPYRRLKIATGLLLQIKFETKMFCSHLTFNGETLQKRFGLIYNPYLMGES